MPDKEGKSWHQKGAVQAAFVGGAFAVALAFFRPSSEPRIVVIPAPSQAVEVRGSSQSAPRADPLEVPPAPAEERLSGNTKGSIRSTGTVSSDKPATAASSLLGLPKSLAPDQPWFLPELETAVTATFRETLGSRYVEITISAPGDSPIRFPARRAGASGRFSAASSIHEVQVLSIDWEKPSVAVIVRAVSGP